MPISVWSSYCGVHLCAASPIRSSGARTNSLRNRGNHQLPVDDGQDGPRGREDHRPHDADREMPAAISAVSSLCRWIQATVNMAETSVNRPQAVEEQDQLVAVERQNSGSRPPAFSAPQEASRFVKASKTM